MTIKHAYKMKAKFAISLMELFHGVTFITIQIAVQQEMVKHVTIFGKDHMLHMMESM